MVLGHCPVASATPTEISLLFKPWKIAATINSVDVALRSYNSSIGSYGQMNWK